MEKGKEKLIMTLSSRIRWNSIGVPSGSNARYVSATESIGDSMTWSKKMTQTCFRKKTRSCQKEWQQIDHQPLAALQLCSSHGLQISNSLQHVMSITRYTFIWLMNLCTMKDNKSIMTRKLLQTLMVNLIWLKSKETRIEKKIKSVFNCEIVTLGWDVLKLDYMILIILSTYYNMSTMCSPGDQAMGCPKELSLQLEYPIASTISTFLYSNHMNQ